MSIAKRRWLAAALWTATACAAGLSVWRCVDVYAPRGGTIAAAVGYAVLGLLLTSVIVTVLHELGHAAFGALAKMDVRSVSVLGFGVIKNATGKGVRLFRADTAYAGATDALPSAASGAEKRYAFMTVGGLWMNAVCVAGCAVCVAIAPLLPLWAYCLTGGGLAAATYALLLNGLPFYAAGTMTDGAVLYHLAAKTDEGKVLGGILRVQAAWKSGVRPKDTDAALLEELPVIPEDNALFLALLSLKFTYYDDCDRWEDAAKTMDRIDGLLSEYFVGREQAFAADRIYAAARSGDVEKTLRLAEQSQKTLQSGEPAAYRAAAVVCLAKGDRDGARAAVQSGLSAAKTYFVKGLRAYETDAIGRIAAAIPESREIFPKKKEAISE